MLEFHQAVLSTLREEEINQENFAADVARLNELAEMAEQQEDENTGPEGETGRVILHVLEITVMFIDVCGWCCVLFGG